METWTKLMSGASKEIDPLPLLRGFEVANATGDGIGVCAAPTLALEADKRHAAVCAVIRRRTLVGKKTNFPLVL